MADQNPIVKCGSCGGTYRRQNPDGTQYFHSCPPLSVAELRDALAQNRVTLAAEDQARIDEATKLDAVAKLEPGELSNVDRVLGTIAIERPNKRDENIAGPGAPGRPAPIKSEGAGVAVK